jgi:hypothetical protein
MALFVLSMVFIVGALERGCVGVFLIIRLVLRFLQKKQ